jgi:hypothetical protein
MKDKAQPCDWLVVGRRKVFIHGVKDPGHPSLPPSHLEGSPLHLSAYYFFIAIATHETLCVKITLVKT